VNAVAPLALPEKGGTGPGGRWFPWWARMLLWSAAFAAVMLGVVFLTPRAAYYYFIWKHAEKGYGAAQFIDAEVLDVREKTGTVALDVGSGRGVREGYVLVIHRGSTYVGRVRIKSVWNDLSGGTVMGAWGPIQVGDSAAIKVKAGQPAFRCGS
jgi:hypothetical protein